MAITKIQSGNDSLLVNDAATASKTIPVSNVTIGDLILVAITTIDGGSVPGPVTVDGVEIPLLIGSGQYPWIFAGTAPSASFNIVIRSAALTMGRVAWAHYAGGVWSSGATANAAAASTTVTTGTLTISSQSLVVFTVCDYATGSTSSAGSGFSIIEDYNGGTYQAITVEAGTFSSSATASLTFDPSGILYGSAAVFSCTSSSPASAYTITLPSSGTVGIAVGTVTLNGDVTAGSVTLSSSLTTGTFTGSPVAFTDGGNATASFTLTVTALGSYNITSTNTWSFANASTNFPTTTGTIVIGHTDLWYTAPATYTNPPQSAFAECHLTATGPGTITLNGSTNANTWSFGHMGILVNGVATTHDFTSDGMESVSATLGSGIYSIILRGGPQTTGGGTTVGGTFLMSFEGVGISSLSKVPAESPSAVGIGDSIFPTGSLATNLMTQGAIPVLRDTYSIKISAEGWGYRKLQDDAGDLAALATKLLSYGAPIIIPIIGRNDYGAAWGSDNFQAGMSTLFDAIHSASATTKVLAVTPTIDTDTSGSLQQYRTAVLLAAAGKSWVTGVNGTTGEYPTASQLADGIHLNTSGQATLALALKNSLDAMGPILSLTSSSLTAVLGVAKTLTITTDYTGSSFSAYLSGTGGTFAQNPVTVTGTQGTATWTATMSGATNIVVADTTNSQTAATLTLTTPGTTITASGSGSGVLGVPHRVTLTLSQALNTAGTLTTSATGGTWGTLILTNATSGTLGFTPTWAGVITPVFAGTNIYETMTPGTLTGGITTPAAAITIVSLNNTAPNPGQAVTALWGLDEHGVVGTAYFAGDLVSNGGSLSGFPTLVGAVNGYAGTFSLSSTTAGQTSTVAMGSSGNGYETTPANTLTLTTRAMTTPTSFSATTNGITSIVVSASGSTINTPVLIVSLNGTTGPFTGGTVTLASGVGLGTLNGLTAGTAYTLAVKERDSYGNLSASSSTASATTWASVILTVAKDGTDPTAISVTWDAVAGAASYEMSKDGGAFSATGITGTTFTDAAGSAATTHTYVLRAYSGAGGTGSIIAEGSAVWTVGGNSRLSWLSFQPVLGRM
jgi:hypothetical protein